MPPPVAARPCPNAFRLIPGGTFQPSRSKKVAVPSFEIQEREVSIRDINLFNEAGRFQAVLSGCRRIEPETITVISNPGEKQNVFEQNANALASELLCDKKNIRIIRITPLPKIEVPMDGPCGVMNKKGDDYPVACLKPEDAALYCHSVDPTATLPQGVQLEFVSYQGGKTPNAVTKENSQNSTAPVCGPETEKRNNLSKVRDIEGNLLEMTRDQYQQDPSGKSNGPVVGLRGGSFFVPKKRAKASDRVYFVRDKRFATAGFRCARLAKQ